MLLSAGNLCDPLPLQFAKTWKKSSEDSALMVTCTLIIVLFSTAVSSSACVLSSIVTRSTHTLVELSLQSLSKTTDTDILLGQVFGSITKPLIEAVLLRHRKPAVSDATGIPSLEDLRLLFIETGNQCEQENGEQPKRSSLSLLIRYPAWTVHYLWRKFDDKFMRPVFGGRGFVPSAPRSPNSEANERPESPWFWGLGCSFSALFSFSHLYSFGTCLDV